VGDPNGPRTLTQWFNTNAFAVPPIATFGNAPNSVFRGPGTNNWDFGAYKNFSLTERLKLQFRAQFFNFFNHPSFNYVDPGMGDAAFGQVTSALDGRRTQFSLDISF
jgi:hypothetical protein